jgi:hypothetical protein
LRQNPFAKKLQTQIVSTQKLREKLLYEKAACKIFVKLTPAVVQMAFRTEVKAPVSLNSEIDSSAVGQTRHQRTDLVKPFLRHDR